MHGCKPYKHVSPMLLIRPTTTNHHHHHLVVVMMVVVVVVVVVESKYECRDGIRAILMKVTNMHNETKLPSPMSSRRRILPLFLLLLRPFQRFHRQLRNIVVEGEGSAVYLWEDHCLAKTREWPTTTNTGPNSSWPTRKKTKTKYMTFESQNKRSKHFVPAMPPWNRFPYNLTFLPFTIYTDWSAQLTRTNHRHEKERCIGPCDDSEEL
mmetsp:Transcript_10353/g.20981  ORF Transcript_10353/g.20981 Transcript_10353/m.20981 type:complete len:209 (-) Transcript_10353:105-731(-)